MKKLIILIIALLISVTNVQAVELKKGSLYCISLKKVTNYDRYKSEGFENFASELMRNSDCFVKNRNERVLLLSKSKNYASVKTQQGFTVWTRIENIIDTKTVKKDKKTLKVNASERKAEK